MNASQNLLAFLRFAVWTTANTATYARHHIVADDKTASPRPYSWSSLWWWLVRVVIVVAAILYWLPIGGTCPSLTVIEVQPRPYMSEQHTARSSTQFEKESLLEKSGCHPYSLSASKSTNGETLEGIQFFLCAKYYPWQKQEPSSRFAARRTLFHVWYHAWSRAISAGQKSRTAVADRTLPCADRSWPSMISHVEQCSSCRKSRRIVLFFFVQGSSRDVLHRPVIL